MITPDNYWGSNLDQLKRMAWYPITTRRKCAAEASKFSGLPMLYSDEKWPLCPGCSRPMHHMLQIRSEDLPEEARKTIGNGYLQLFFCVNEDYECEISIGNYEAFSKGYIIRIIDSKYGDLVAADQIPVERPFPELAIVGWRPQSDYPCWDDAKAKGIKQTYEDAEQVESAGFPRKGDKLMGWAAWQQGAELPDCPECGSVMSYIIQLDSEDNIPYMFGDVGSAYITQCEQHKDILTLTWAGG